MKNNLLLSAFGVSAALSILASGCTNEVMGDRRYAPPAADDNLVAFQQQDPAANDLSVTDAEPVKAELKEEFPRMEAFDASSSAAPAKETAAAAESTYVVKKGDTLGAIGRKYGVDYRAIMEVNGITNPRRLRIGQKLTIPAAGTVASKSFVSSITREVSRKSTAKAGKMSSAPVKMTASGEYVVQRGDNVSTIARKLKVKSRDLMAVNGLDESSARRLQIGQKLKVPGAAGAVASTAVDVPDLSLDKQSQSADMTSATDKSSESSDSTGSKSDANAIAPAAETSVSGNAAAAAGSSEAAEVTIDIADTVPVEVKEDIDLAAFAAQNKTTVEILKKCNLDEFPADGKLKKGTIIFIPAAK